VFRAGRAVLRTGLEVFLAGREVFLAGREAGQQGQGGGADRVHRLVECLGVVPAGEADAPHRPHVLERGRMHVVVGYADGIRGAQGFDIAAHDDDVTPP